MDNLYPWEEMSAFPTHVGTKLVHWEENKAVFELEIADIHLNRSQIPHGGVNAFLLDMCMGYAGFYREEGDEIIKSLTLSMTVNFVGQPKGQKLIATGTVTGGGRKTYFTEGRVEDELGTLIATGQAVFKRLIK